MSIRIKCTIVLLIIFNIYLFFGIIFFDKGLVKYFEITKQVTENKDRLEFVREKNNSTEKKLKLLNSKRVSKAYLSELGKREFGFVPEDDYVILQ